MWSRIRVPLTITLLLGAAWYVLHKLLTSREWTEFRGDRFWHGLTQVRWLYVLLGAAGFLCSYIFRSMRWRVFLLPIKTGRLAHILSATLIGYSAVALLGRPGELVRPYLIAGKERVPLSSQLGIWTLERIFDGLTVGILIGGALLLFPPASSLSAGGARMIPRLQTGGLLLFIGGAAVMTLLLLLRNHTHTPLKLLRWVFQTTRSRGEGRLQMKLENMLESFTHGLASIRSGQRFLACVMLSQLVWIPVLFTYWVVTRAFGAPMAQIGLGGISLLMAITVAGSLMQIPGVGGGFQISIVLVLTELFGIPLETATTEAILLWAVCFLMVLIPGVPLAASEGLSWRRLRALTGSGSQASGETGAAVAADS